MGVVVVDIQSTSDDASRRVRRRGAVQIGRGPDNDVVIVDAKASWNHALVYLDRGELWVRDLGSKNGTRVDGEPIARPTRLTTQSRLSIGDVELRVQSLPDTVGPYLVEDLASGVQHPIVSERFVIGADTGAHLRHTDVEERATLMLVGHGEIWVGQRGEDWPVTLDEPFVIDGARFVVREASTERVPTVEVQARPYAYVLEASLDLGPGPRAQLEDPLSHIRCQFTAETRAILLYTLGQQVLADRDTHCAPADEGWVADLSLVSSVWGRTSELEGRARLKTLVHRVRHDCRTAGLDPWCVEKRSGHTRLRVDAVHIPGHGEP